MELSTPGCCSKLSRSPRLSLNSWLKGQQAAPPQPSSAQLTRGLQVYQQRTCISCHAIGLMGKQVGPDLTHLASRTTIGAGVLDNNPSNLTKWLQNPQAVKPGIYMPNVQLSRQELLPTSLPIWRR